MHKKWKGYFTVEASFILPIILFLYLLIILAALFLYCRCAISQDDFLLGMRAERFTGEENGCGEVIYGLKDAGAWPAESYVKERVAGRRGYYPFFPTTEGDCRVQAERIVVRTLQKASGKPIIKELYKTNPVGIIREGRKGHA
ncbi:MAG: hypothetical protein NC400_06335 [Clostridium sp.]|nr:hypothetical protein [Clostridium sp.]